MDQIPSRNFVFIDPRNLIKLENNSVEFIHAFSQPILNFTQSQTVSTKELLEMLSSKETTTANKIKNNPEFTKFFRTKQANLVYHVYALKRKYVNFDQ